MLDRPAWQARGFEVSVLGTALDSVRRQPLGAKSDEFLKL